MRPINPTQALILTLIEQHVAFNDCDGPAIVGALRESKELWRGLVMQRNGEALSLLCLRDIEENIWAADTMYIVPEPGKEDALLALAETLGADEVGWLQDDDAQHRVGFATPVDADQPKVLRLWWD